MNITWLEKKNSDSLIVFFNGWGMDEHSISHLKNDGYDILMFNDYRGFEFKLTLKDKIYIANHKKTYLIAWSMGVWGAAKGISLPFLSSLDFEKTIAINGTLMPIDNDYGIPIKGYIITEKGIKFRGMDKFFMRMFNDNNNRRLFKEYMPQRLLETQISELIYIREMYNSTEIFNFCGNKNILWDKVYMSKEDMIFPFENQFRFWNQYDTNNYQYRNLERIELRTEGHYPFFLFKSWKNIIEDGNSKN